MADSLIFPVSFDLAAAVSKAQGDIDTVLRQLETSIKSRPLDLRLNIKANTPNLDNLQPGSIEAIKARMAQLVAEWNKLSEAQRISITNSGQYTGRAKQLIAEYSRLVAASESYARTLQQISSAAAKAAKEESKRVAENKRINGILTAQENTLAAITAKLRLQRQLMNSAKFGSDDFRRAAEEVDRLTAKVDEAKQHIAAASGQAAAGVNRTSAAFSTQDGYVSRLVKRLAVYASFAAVSGFLRNVREVTAQFELQRVSLAALIQDQRKADKIFSQIKSFALQSPMSVMDLTKYTKQVAAYRIETDKLFDTTKRLADVSVGLGVDMGRIVLAYGQVKAASYLRASEIRQFTEAGIPMLELLAEKLTALNGETVTTADAMEMVSKRMVSFSVVEEIFRDMTDAGGMFYNMQEKQSQTLYGMWAKLGDAAALMYDEIGNTDSVNTTMKLLTSWATTLMDHWSGLSNVMQIGIIGFVAYKAAMAGLIPGYKLLYIQQLNGIKAEKALQATRLKQLSLFANLTTSQLRQLSATKALTQAEWQEYITKTKLNSVSALRLARLAAEDTALRKALVSTKLYTAGQLQQIQAMSRGQYMWAKMKAGMLGIGNTLKSLGASLASCWPLAVISTVISLFNQWHASAEAIAESTQKVREKYKQNETEILKIENAYNNIKTAVRGAGESEDAFIKASYGQKLAQLQKVIKMLDSFGIIHHIDTSVIGYDEIDGVLEAWLGKLHQVNSVTSKLGVALAPVLDAWEGNVMGWSIGGENLKEDMKDVTRSFSKWAYDSQFNTSIEQLRTIMESLKTTNNEVYTSISRAIGADATYALSQKRRNESELNYQRRIAKNYEEIYGWLAVKDDYKGSLPSMYGSQARLLRADFESDVEEIFHEFDKVKEVFRGQDALTVRAAIDTTAAENKWADWQRDLLIEHLNENPITLNAELIPVGDNPLGDNNVINQGIKQIIQLQFPELFTADELANLGSVSNILTSIEEKMRGATSSLKLASSLQNRFVAGASGYEEGLARIQQIQNEIAQHNAAATELQTLKLLKGAHIQLSDEQISRMSQLEAEQSEWDSNRLEALQNEITAITEANALYDEQIEKINEASEAEQKLATEALERLTDMQLSDIGRDVKENLSELFVDHAAAASDNNYSSDFLISSGEEIQTLSELYDMYSKSITGIAREKEELANAGLSETAIAQEQAEIDNRRLQINRELNTVKGEIAKFEETAEYRALANLRTQLAQATTAADQKKIQSQINTLLSSSAYWDYQRLLYKKGALEASLNEVNTAQLAANQAKAELETLDKREELWKDLGKRYNFTLKDTSAGSGGGEDPWITLMKNRMKYMEDFQKGVEELGKWMGVPQGLSSEQENMYGRGMSLGIDSRGLNGSADELVAWYEDAIEQIRNKIGELGGREWEGLGVQLILAKDTKSKVLKKYQELLSDVFESLTDFRTARAQRALETKLKEIADNISRTKTAKEFFDKMLTQTGSAELALKLSTSIYGTTGDELFEQTVAQIREVFRTGTADSPIELDISAAIDTTNQRINYRMLADIYEEYKDQIIEKNRDAASTIVSEGQKEAANNVATWEKELAKAKDFAQQRLDLIRQETQRRAQIIKSNLPQEEKDRLVGQSYTKQNSGIADLNYKEFKSSDDYVKIFRDLGNTSTAALKRLREEMQRLIDTNHDLSPENMKALVKAMDDIDKEIAGRGFGNVMVQSAKDYIQASRDLSAARTEQTAVQAEYTAQRPQLDADIDTAKAEQAAAQQALNALKENEAATESEIVAAELRLNSATEAVAEAEGRKAAAAQKVQDAERKVTDAQDKQKKAQQDFNDDLERTASILGQISSMVGDIKDLLGADDDSTLGMAFDAATSSLKTMQSAIGIVTSAQTAYNAVCAANPYVAGGAAVIGVFSAISSFLTSRKVKKANKEIEKQQDILDDLEYTYSRLQDLADGLFGEDYINNYNNQIEVLEAQQAAYLKQAEAEESKGKKADEDKIEEYKEKARETADEIAELEGELVEKFVGSSRSDLAAEFAESWIEAKLSFEDTTEAIKEQYADMVKSMIVQGAAAKIIDTILAPMWEEMQSLLEAGDTEGAIEYLLNNMDTFLNDSENGLQAFWSGLQAKGYDLSNMFGEASDLTGTSRNIASASEEDINGLTVATNTQNAYISMILDEVRGIHEGMGLSGVSPVVDWPAITTQSLSHLNAIEQHSAAAVTACQEAASACLDIVGKIERVTDVTGGRPAIRIR